MTIIAGRLSVPYFLGYKTEFFPSKTRKGKIGIIAKFHRTDLVI